MLLSLFCGAGGLDLGFEQAGYNIALGYDRNAWSIASYNRNRAGSARGRVGDVARLTLDQLDEAHGSEFKPRGVIGGPPCQSFSIANVRQTDDDPRHQLPSAFAALLGELNRRNPVDFFVMENVEGLTQARHRTLLASIEEKFREAGFTVARATLDAMWFGTPQSRSRLFLVGFNSEVFEGAAWTPPAALPMKRPVTVRDAIGDLPAPAVFERGLMAADVPHHPNHWCMKPRSPKFQREGALREGDVKSRSFKTLAWDHPSITVAYGNREVHIHPSGKRRLSVFEAMKLQGFPNQYELAGSLTSQITQVSEAVPPPLARAVALSVKAQLNRLAPAAEGAPTPQAA